MAIMHLIILILLSAWFLLNVVFVFFASKIGRYIYKFDFFGWISSHTLFSMEARSFSLYYRDKFIDGNYSGWNKVELNINKWYNMFWAPANLVTSTVYSAVDDLAKAVEHFEVEPLKSNFTNRLKYKIVAKYVLNIDAGETVIARQFKLQEIKGITGNYTNQPVFESEYHPL